MAAPAGHSRRRQLGLDLVQVQSRKGRAPEVAAVITALAGQVTHLGSY
jgi:hypothetical protein